MGCQSEVNLGDNLTFSIVTHDPTTGIRTDADAAPPYRVYEDETGAAILTGTMAILDNPNTTGFYTELLACTAANGFEDRRSYNIYIEATVNGDTGGISYGFRVTDALSISGCINFTYTVVSTVAPNPPIPGVAVTVSTDLAGTNVIWGGTTDAFGVARDGFGQVPCLVAGTYYFWRNLAGWSFSNPDTEVVS
ncbi:MAG: hypothetical protein ACYTDW_19675 [Planctomycetota bacterium]|jgi:hypothetical protein